FPQPLCDESCEGNGQAPPDLDLGEGPAPRVDGYRVLERIDAGATSIIYRAEDLDLNSEVAIKVLRQDRPDLAERFHREPSITARLQQGVPPVYRRGKLNDGRPYFIMALVRGESLKGHLARRQGVQEERPRFVNIFKQVAEAVAHAHFQGVIHRD